MFPAWRWIECSFDIWSWFRKRAWNLQKLKHICHFIRLQSKCEALKQNIWILKSMQNIKGAAVQLLGKSRNFQLDKFFRVHSLLNVHSQMSCAGPRCGDKGLFYSRIMLGLDWACSLLLSCWPLVSVGALILFLTPRRFSFIPGLCHFPRASPLPPTLRSLLIEPSGAVTRQSFQVSCLSFKREAHSCFHFCSAQICNFLFSVCLHIWSLRAFLSL